MPIIRLAAERDLPAITDLMRWAAEETTATFTIHPRSLEEWSGKWQRSRAFYPWLVASEGDQFLGFAKSSPFRDNDAYAWTAEVSVYVRPEHHGKGIARDLYSRLFSQLHLQGYFAAVAVVTSENEGSIRFHERIGMKRTGTLSEVGFKFDRKLGIVFFELALQDSFQKPGPILSVAEAAG